ncbi:MAG: hypothetical protein OEV56_04510, partial [Dehalococcoidia bacterium]|nr:hypothetical protein [Dehalococcoidia bacterium]
DACDFSVTDDVVIRDCTSEIYFCFLLSKKARIIDTSIHIMIRINPKDKASHTIGVKPPSVTSKAAVTMPTINNANAGHSRIL